MMPITVGVVIPAWNEEQSLAGCLASLLSEPDCDGIGLQLEIVVVANGCTDNTAAVARQFGRCAPGTSCVHVLELCEPGKPQALNAGDEHLDATSEPLVRVYLDADVALSRGSIAALASLLAQTATPLCASPRPIMCLPEDRFARSYAQVWQHLPGVRNDVLGAGCYAVNRAGRRRWNHFPDVIADDAFVRTQFSREERVVLDEANFFFRFPDSPGYLDVLARWRRGNQELEKRHDASDPGSKTLASLRWLATARRQWPHTPGFLAVTALSRIRPKGARRGWPRTERVRHRNDPVSDPRIDAVVVSYNNESQIERCIVSLHRALRSRGSIAVVDNASSDRSCDQIDALAPSLSLDRRTTNLGFAAAVNFAAERSTADYILLVNPDAELQPDTIDALLQLAAFFPDAGIYGGTALQPDGHIDTTTCLAAPSLWSALAFGTGLSAFKGAPVLDPESLGAWDRDTVRAVPALAGTVLLVDTHLWRDLNGFDEAFFLYGEDVDLCLRAARKGYASMFSPTARYRHVGGASSGPLQRMTLVLTGRSTLHRRYLPPRRARLACACLKLGVAIRAVGETAIRRPNPEAAVWAHAWRTRKAWETGWPVSGTSHQRVTDPG